MNKLFLIAFSNIKKKKGAMLIITILIVFSTFLSYISISTLTNLDKNIEKSFQYSNLPDVEFVMPQALNDIVLDAIHDQPGVVDLESTPCLTYVSAKYQKYDSDEAKDFGFILQDISKHNILSRNTSDTDGINFPEDGIILAQYMQSTGAFKVNDPFILIIDDMTFRFKVCCFSEDALFATPLNINEQKMFINSNMYAHLKDVTKSQHPDTCDYKVKISESVSATDFEKNVIDNITANYPDLDNTPYCSINREDLSHGIKIIPAIAMAIILAFSVILMIIAISIIYYNIKNFMEENLPNIGILKASGYTSNELILSLLIEVLIVTFFGIVIGLIAGFASAPLIGTLEAAMMGILWRIGIDPVAAAAAALIVFIMILTITLLLGKRYRKIFVLDALRGGFETHNFRKNYFPLDTTKLSLICSLGFKDIFHEKRKNICILLITVFLTFASCTGIYLYKVYGTDQNSLLLLSGIEVSDIIVTTDDTRYEDFDPTTITGIKDVMYHNNMSVTVEFNGIESNLDCDIWDKPENIKNDIMGKGRLPENDNEITLSSTIARELGADVGDIVYIHGNKASADYMIVGIDQKINHLGRKAMLTFEGINRCKSDIIPVYIYLNCEDGYTFSMLENIIKEEYPSCNLNEGSKYIDSITSGIQSVVFSLCLLFLIFTLLIVFMILLMIGKSRIIQKRQQLGISKALGFTTSQLISQNILSTVPVVFAGGIIGMICSIFWINPIITLGFQAFGITSFSFSVNPVLYLIMVIAITVEATLVTFIASIRIKNIEPINMIRSN